MDLRRADYLIVSCEHGGNRVPSRFRKLISKRFLNTHRGYDPGALALAHEVAAATGAPLFYSTVTRLLVELNRPLGHPQLFSKDFVEATREALLRRYYIPYWRGIETAIRKAVRRGRRVRHLSVHSFTPKLAGVRRTTDIGLLFDPRHATEAAFGRAWRDEILRTAAACVCAGTTLTRVRTRASSPRCARSSARAATSASRSRSTRDSRAATRAAGGPCAGFSCKPFLGNIRLKKRS
jgi:N-formylglutamate amidohydrolase